MSTEHDRDVVARQLDALRVLDEAHRGAVRTSGALGAFFLFLGAAFPLAKALGMALRTPTSGPGFVQRLADVPIWVVLLMLGCGLLVGGLGLKTAWRLHRSGSPALAHLRTTGDPFVSAQTTVVVRRGYRSATFHLTSRGGTLVNELVPGTLESQVAAAIARCIPQR